MEITILHVLGWMLVVTGVVLLLTLPFAPSHMLPQFLVVPFGIAGGLLMTRMKSMSDFDRALDEMAGLFYAFGRISWPAFSGFFIGVGVVAVVFALVRVVKVAWSR